MESQGWTKVGEVGVDAGLLWVGDPCYCVTPDADEHPAKSWEAFCQKLDQVEKDGVARWPYKRGHEGLGITVSTGFGDGSYPVYVRRVHGRIAEVRVAFIEERE